MKVIDVLSRMRTTYEVIIYYKDQDGYPAKKTISVDDAEATLKYGSMDVVEIGTIFDLKSGFEFLTITAEANTAKAKRSLYGD